MNWWLIIVGVLAIFIVLKLIHFNHNRTKVTAVIVIIILLFIAGTFMVVVKTHNIDLKSASGVMSAGKVYVVWLGQAFSNVKALTGEAIHMDWLPKNVSVNADNFGKFS